MRRTLVAALAAALFTPAAAAAAGPRAVDFELGVHSAGSARAASATVTLRPHRRFDLFGLTRSAGHVHARVFDPRKGWRKWVELHGTDPAWAGGATALQLRAHGPLRNVRAHFVRITRRASPRGPVARAAADQPPIVPRSDWAGTQCNPRSAPDHGEVRMAFIHHTVTANEYTAEDSPSMVLAVCRYHRNSNGWQDIGYNFVVDKYGQIFEGRAGGIDQAIIGAQAQGFNSVSTGISNLGTYSDVPQSDLALDAMGRLLAWKLPLHGAPVTGQVVVTSQGGSSNRYPSGTAVTFERISGHRDGNSTECPGTQLYAQLPRIRELAGGAAPFTTAPQSDGVPAALTLLPGAPAFPFPAPVHVSGSLTDVAGAGVAGRRVQVQIGTTQGWRTVTSAVTGGDGAWSADFAATRTWDVRAFAGTLTSPRTTAIVVPTLTAKIAASRVQAGRSAVVSGHVRPRKRAVLIQAWRQIPRTTRFVLAFTLAGRTSGTGRYRTPIRLRRAGLYRFRVRFPGDRRNGAVQAPDLFVRAVRRLTAGTGGQGAR